METKTLTGAEYRAMLLEAASKIRENDTFLMTFETLRPSSPKNNLRAAAYYFDGNLMKIGRVQL
jgi:hypothetical protein